MSLLLRFHPNDRASSGNAVFTAIVGSARLMSSTGEAIAPSETDAGIVQGITVNIAEPTPLADLVMGSTALCDVTIIRLPGSINQ